MRYRSPSRRRADNGSWRRAVFEASDFDTVGPPETHDIEYNPYQQGLKKPVGGDE